MQNRLGTGRVSSQEPDRKPRLRTGHSVKTWTATNPLKTGGVESRPVPQRPVKSRTGAPRSPKRTWAENDGRPEFPATGRHQRPRVRLSLRKAAWSSSTPTRSTGNPGEVQTMAFPPSTAEPSGLPTSMNPTLCPTNKLKGGRIPQPFTRNPKQTTNHTQDHIHESKSPWILSYAIANYDL